VNARPATIVFVLWGNQAKARRPAITAAHHRIVESGHPSPLSARHFLGCRCFSAANRHLVAAGRGAIDWRAPREFPVFDSRLGATAPGTK
jgi:uracil DNA glycosylase